MTSNPAESNIVFFTRLHWIIFLGPILAFCAALAVHTYFPQLAQISLFLEALFLLWIAITWVTYYFSSITIKKKQVILCTGVLVRKIVDIPLSKIETIDIRQSILGSILRYGTIVITGTGGTRHMIDYLSKPLTCRRYIEQSINEPQ